MGTLAKPGLTQHGCFQGHVPQFVLEPHLLQKNSYGGPSAWKMLPMITLIIGHKTSYQNNDGFDSIHATVTAPLLYYSSLVIIIHDHSGSVFVIVSVNTVEEYSLLC